MVRKTSAELYGTDPSGILASGPPSGGGSSGAGASVGPAWVSSGPTSTLGGLAGSSASSGPGLSISMGAAPPPVRNQNVQLKAKGGKVKKMAKGGSASSRGDGCASKGKTKGRFV